MSRPRRPALHQGLATRLLIGQTIVLLAGAPDTKEIEAEVVGLVDQLRAEMSAALGL